MEVRTIEKVGALIVAICVLAAIIGHSPVTAFLVYGVFVLLTEFVYVSCLVLINWLRSGEWKIGIVSKSFLYELITGKD